MILEIIYNYFLQILFGYLLADFIMGIYHWIKDTYFSPFTPIIGKSLIWGSRLHHIRPRYVIEFTDWELFYSSAKWTLIWMGPLFYFTGINLFMISLFLTIGLNDVVHKYAHMLDYERPMWATFLQSIYLFQSHDEHHLHHISPHEINYCPITPFLNIILEKINFWKKAEGYIENVIGVKARAKEDKYIEDPDYPAGIKFIED
jgi:hypothetical protein